MDRLSARSIRRSASAIVLAATAGAGAFALLPGAAHAAIAARHGTHHAKASPGYVFQTLDNPADPTFNQLLGINVKGVISGYFGSGAAGHPNKGYLLNPPYTTANYVNENFPSSVQTQVTALNNKGDTAGFWVDGHGNNRDFVEWNGVFASYHDPSTPSTAGSVNQLLGINDAGTAAGFYNDKAGNSHAVTLNQATGKFTLLKVPGTSRLATGINDAGAIVGISTDAAKVTSSWLLANGHLTGFQFPGGSDTQAFGINSKDQIVGSYLDASGVTHGFLLTSPTGPVSHWTSIDDPNGIGSTVVNGINSAGDLVGFYNDAAGNTHGMLATPAVSVTKNLTLSAMPYGTVAFGQDSSGDLDVTAAVSGLTPGSAHTVELVPPTSSGQTVMFGTLTANGVGVAGATLDSTTSGGVPSGDSLVILDGTKSTSPDNTVIAQTASLSGTPSSPVALTAVEVSPAGTSYGTPKGTAVLTYDPAAQTISVTVNATGVDPGNHAAHIHIGSCASQGGVQYMLMDFTANSAGQIVNETRTVTGVTIPVPPSGWYLNLHEGNSSNILSNGVPTIYFRPLLCSDI